ncbi:SNG1 family protein [Paenibacillus sp. P26]|nr:SNG1 family protein [Paenibacillus sp. P26]
MTVAVNKEAATVGTQAVLVQANFPASQAQGTAQGLVDKVGTNLVSLNPVQGMNNQMVPMMMVLSSFVGAMIMGMNLQQSTMGIGPSVSRWSKFGARVLINVTSAFVIALVGSAMTVLLGAQTAGGFIALWLFQSLFLMTFMFFSQMFLIVFGMAGMLFNIIMLSVQLVSSGAMVPRESARRLLPYAQRIFACHLCCKGEHEPAVRRPGHRAGRERADDYSGCLRECRASLHSPSNREQSRGAGERRSDSSVQRLTRVAVRVPEGPGISPCRAVSTG